MDIRDTSIIKRAENRIRQQLFGMLALIVSGLMVMNSFGLFVSADSDLTNLSFNVAAGSFTIANITTVMNFAGQNYGVANTVAGNQAVEQGAVTDYRGNAQSWTVAAASTNLTNGANEIDADRLTLYTTSATLTNIENSTTAYTAMGSTGTLNDTGMTLMNGSTQASGIIQFDAGSISLDFWSTDQAGDYTAVVTYTLS